MSAALFPKLLLVGCGLLLAAPPGGGQVPSYDVHPDYVVKHFTVADGLPVNTITGLVQGRAGYLWMTTFDGLARFDGHRFTVFNTGNSPDLPSNRLYGLRADPGGTLSMITESGMLVQYRQGRFTALGPDDGVPGHIHHLTVEGDTLWLHADEGLAYLVGGTLHPFRPDIIPRQMTVPALRDRTGARWVEVERDSLFRFGSAGQVQRFAFPQEAGQGRWHIMSIQEDARGQLWVGLGGANDYVGTFYRWKPPGFVRAHPSDSVGAVRWIRSVPGHPERLRLGAWEQGMWTYADGALTPFPAVEPGDAGACIEAEGALWCTQGPWLYRDQTPILRVALPRDNDQLLFDQEGNIWLGGDGGLYRIRRRPLQTLSVADGLPHNNLYPIFQDRAGAVWLGLWDREGVGDQNIVRLHEGGVQVYPGPQTCCTLSFHEDRQGTLWVGSIGRLCRIQQGRCRAASEDVPLMRDARPRALYEDRQGRFWIGQEDRLQLRQTENGQTTWTTFTTADGLTHDWVRVITETRDGHLLLGTNGGGIMRYHDDPVRGHVFEPFTTQDGLASDVVRDLYEAADGYLWVATEDRGLCRLDRHGRATLRGATARCLTAQDGLFDDGLHRILEDDYGRFWFNTNRGIFHVEHAELNAFAEGERAFVTSLAYTERDGMLNREGNGGVQPAGIKAADGRLWLPTQQGAVVVDPAQVERPAPPTVVIEEVQVAGVAQPLGAPHRLPPGERDVEIAYTAVLLSGQEEVQFQHRLDGYDEAWRDAGDRRRATYTNLAPGAYTFRVRARRGGAWSTTDATVALQRLPFFWETRWFSLLTVLGAALLVVGGVRYRFQQAEARSRMLERRVADRTQDLRAALATVAEQAEELKSLDAAKSRFFANVSHEFRTPLTLIIGPLRSLLAGQYGPQTPAAAAQLQLMLRNSRRLLRLVNQILDLAQLEQDRLQLRARRQDLVPFLAHIVEAFRPLAAERGLQLRFTHPSTPCWLYFDVQHLEVVVLNLLSNAFKFTPRGGDVRVEVEEIPGALRLSVTDTGRGISAEGLEKIFDRFHQEEGSQGTGIGLALVRELVHLHGGAITATSTLGQGTTFVVDLPGGCDHLGADQVVTEPEAAANGQGDGWDTAATPSLVSTMAPQEAPPDADAPEEEDVTTVLVVDDNPDLRQYIRSVLAPAYRVLEAADGEAGLLRVRADLPDLVVSDVMMPHQDGFAFSRALKEDPMTAHIPVILLTAKASKTAALEGLDTGADDYLTKPFDAGELLARIRNQLAMRERLRARYQGNGSPAPPAPEAAQSPLEAQARQVIRAHLSDPDFSVKDLAHALNLSYGTLNRQLRVEAGTKGTTLIRQVRLEEAAALLQAQAGSVSEVAYGVGFRNLSYFSRCFRAQYGVMPSAYVA